MFLTDKIARTKAFGRSILSHSMRANNNFFLVKISKFFSTNLFYVKFLRYFLYFIFIIKYSKMYYEFTAISITFPVMTGSKHDLQKISPQAVIVTGSSIKSRQIEHFKYSPTFPITKSISIPIFSL